MTTTADPGYATGNSETQSAGLRTISGWWLLYVALLLLGLGLTAIAAIGQRDTGPDEAPIVSAQLALALENPPLLEPDPGVVAPTEIDGHSLAELGNWVHQVEELPPLSGPARRIERVNITFYDCANQGFCGAMFGGRRVYEGAAACSWNLPIGTRFVIEGDPTFRVYTCEDRGLLDDTWVDIFWYRPSDGYAWQSGVGRYGTIELVE